MSDPLDAGDPAPDFDLPADGGGALSLRSLRGRGVVLYFYPKDDTPGCTREAIGFTERIADFEAAGVAVIGASKDSPAKHDKFVAKHGLKVQLVSDADGSLCENYGTWVEKNRYGRKYMGIDRATFLIDADGVVRRAWRKVKVTGHVDKVLAAARELRQAPAADTDGGG